MSAQTKSKINWTVDKILMGLAVFLSAHIFADFNKLEASVNEVLKEVALHEWRITVLEHK